MGLQSGERKSVEVLIETLQISTFHLIQMILVCTNLHSKPYFQSDYNCVSSMFPIRLLRMSNFSNIVLKSILKVFWHYHCVIKILQKHESVYQGERDRFSFGYMQQKLFLLVFFLFQIHKIQIQSGPREVTCVNDPCPCTLLSSEDSFNHIYPYLQ